MWKKESRPQKNVGWFFLLHKPIPSHHFPSAWCLPVIMWCVVNWWTVDGGWWWSSSVRMLITSNGYKQFAECSTVPLRYTIGLTFGQCPRSTVATWSWTRHLAEPFPVHQKCPVTYSWGSTTTTFAAQASTTARPGHVDSTKTSYTHEQNISRYISLGAHIPCLPTSNARHHCHNDPRIP